MPIVTKAILEKLKTEKGGYNRRTLEAIGVGWPPNRGWRKKLLGSFIQDDLLDVLLGQKNKRLTHKTTEHIDQEEKLKELGLI